MFLGFEMPPSLSEWWAARAHPRPVNDLYPLTQSQNDLCKMEFGSLQGKNLQQPNCVTAPNASAQPPHPIGATSPGYWITECKDKAGPSGSGRHDLTFGSLTNPGLKHLNLLQRDDVSDAPTRQAPSHVSFTHQPSSL